MGEPISRADLTSAAEQLRTVLITIPADPDHAAYLRGAADTLAMLAGPADDPGRRPETKVTGRTVGSEISSRSLAGIVRTVETLRERSIMLRSLREGIDYSTPVGRMVAGIFASLAEYERELIHERAAVARQAARARGKQTGRPRALSPDQVGVARRMREAGESVATICATFKGKHSGAELWA